jgi:hypothetical protein
MRIRCPHCGKNAFVTHSRPLSQKITELSCVCRDEECASRFVMRLSHSHDLTPPRSTLLDSLAEQIAGLPENERRALIKQYAS